MLSTFATILVLPAILVTANLLRVNSAESQILDCTNSTEPSLCSNRTIELSKNNTANKAIDGHILPNARRDISEVCANNQEIGALICSETTNQNSSAQDQPIKPVQVFIRTPNNVTQFAPGSSLTIECRFLVDSTILNQDFRFKLKWMRSVAGAQNNQSIVSTEPDSPLTIIAATTRLWTVQRNGGLDLELNNYQEEDVGSYFCQALRSDTGAIISEAHLRLTLDQVTATKSSVNDELGSGSGSDQVSGTDLYSPENLSSLLPSLKVTPSFEEVANGATIQLICTTSHLDPDPEPNLIEWSFEAVENRKQLLHRTPTVTNELPFNVSVLGNVLVVWSMSEEHCGIYKCTVKLPDFNLSVQAAGELSLKPTSESAPLVFVSPEIVRISPNGSARIQCEATGYPPPEVVWYRVEDAQAAQQPAPSGELQIISNTAEISHKGDNNNNIMFEQIPYQDAVLYCDQNRCQAGSHRSSVTSVSLILIKKARAEHQGQWVCRASNKHGSNQASSLIDVEFREPPIVAIAPEFCEQTIVLSNESIHQKPQQHNATFKCSAKSGKPQPRLHWLRTTNVGTKTNNQLVSSNNLDTYDLTRVSSATSKVSVYQENRGKSLVLVISTISLDDEGDYVCLGENEWGRHSAVAHLTVRQPASVRILQASPLIARPNDSFHLDCLATGHPVPLDIEWSRYDRGAFFSLISRSSSGSSPSGSHEKAMLKFDRVSVEESGEYTCNARDPLNGSLILRDTIMVLVESDTTNHLMRPDQQMSGAQSALLPKLMVRPTKVTAPLGSNVTLDCLAVSGLQPTVVEWLAPSPLIDQIIMPPGSIDSQAMTNQSVSQIALIWPYYRSGQPAGGAGSRLMQFGSKLRILNVSKQHEGVYQCKGSNRIGAENAPALIRVLEPEVGDSLTEGANTNAAFVAKTKVAKIGSNIELKCQVKGVEQPETSWSREGLELPLSSVQIEHNLWIQNVSQNDSGQYVCSARSQQPNKVIQAKINLLVIDQSVNSSNESYNLTAKIVASKNTVNLGDSITLECIVNSLLSNKDTTTDSAGNRSKSIDLDEIERQVIWTNTHSGQSVFQDNVYILNNLLIIYDLKPENSATYRCNYNEFMQHTDYRLQVIDSNEPWKSNDTSSHNNNDTFSGPTEHLMIGSRENHAQLKQIALGSYFSLECPHGKHLLPYRWLRGTKQQAVGSESAPLVFDAIQTNEADIYHCYHNNSSKQTIRGESKFISFVVQVLVPVARFPQKPVSFITLPSISGANQQLEIDLKFLAEREHGLILFNGQRQWNRSSVGDYISLGLNKGFLEFRFELGDGTTLLRSSQSVTLNRWHRVFIERNRKGAVMWLDKQPPVSNSSAGKFFNLNLDSVLYVGGNQYFLNKSRSNNQNQTSRFYGYSRGFQGCVSLLRIGRNEINLMARNRSASIGIYECDKPECRSGDCGAGVCQVDRSIPLMSFDPERPRVRAPDLTSGGQRCICPPGLAGDHCELPSSVALPEHNTQITTPIYGESSNQIVAELSKSNTTTTMTTTPKPGGACELLNPCSANGTQTCQSLTSTSFRCHCQLGFMGDTCSHEAQFSNETSLWFNQQAYLQFRFNRPDEVQSYDLEHSETTNTELASSARRQTNNLTNFARLTSMAETQSISFNLQTKSSYGLIFYMGQAHSLLESANNGTNPMESISQTSKSMVANLLARLSSIVFDYLAIALVDGHVELSYELGSGVAIIRSSERVNDGQAHQLRVVRNGRSARLTIDDSHKHEGSSPGKLSMLNCPPDIYLGGLPHLAELTHNMYMSGFVGCVSSLQINSLGPINLIHSNHLSQVRSARNLAPCPASSSLIHTQTNSTSFVGSAANNSTNKTTSTSTPPPTTTTTTTQAPDQQTTKHRPYQAPTQPESDDPDEM